MSSLPVWNLRIAANLTLSLKQFVNLKISKQYRNLDQTLNNLQLALEQNQGEQLFLLEELNNVLKNNRWTISCIEEDLINLSLGKMLFCASDRKIITLKSLPARVAGVEIIVNESSYLLVAALSQCGKVLYHWKDQKWSKTELDLHIHYEPYYFYYCKAPRDDIKQNLKFKGYEKIYLLFEDQHIENNSLPNVSETPEISQSAIIDESKANDEIIEKEKKDAKDQESQTENKDEKVQKLKLSIKNLQQNVKRLQDENKESQKTINSLNSEICELKEQKEASKKQIKCKQESEIANLEKEKKEMRDTIQLLHNQSQQMSMSHHFQLDQLEKLNHDLVDENNSLREECRKLKENIVIELPPNRKHGLPNLGNTCYLNSLLQIFSSTPGFESTLQNINGPFSKSLKDLLLNMKRNNTPRTIGDLIKLFISNLVQDYPFLQNYTQQDPKEVLNMILSKLIEEKRTFDIFSIAFEQKLTCMKNHKFKVSDINSFLLIPPQYKECPEYFLLNKIQNNSQIKSYCSSCKKEVDITVSVLLSNYPQQLIFYFPTSPDVLRDHINFNQNIAYELYGTICYYQEESSHYTAFTKDGTDWNEYNDEHVEAKSINPLLVTLAFYSKVSPSIPGMKAVTNPLTSKKNW